MEIKNIGQLIQHLFIKAGGDVNDKNLVNILSNAELSKVTIHSDLVKALDENLLSVEAATDNHPKISAHYKAQSLNPFDKRMQALIDELGFDDDTKNLLTGTRSSYTRFETLSEKIKDLIAAKASAANKGDKDVLQKQIDDLQLKLKTATESITGKEAEFAKQLSAAKIEFALREKLGTRKTIFDNLTADIRQSSLMSVINKALEDKDAQLSYDDKNNLQLLKKDGTKLYGANHTLITLDEIIDSSLAQNKILVVAEPTKQNQQQNQQQVVIPGGSDAISGTNQSVVDFNTQQLQAMADGATT